VRSLQHTIRQLDNARYTGGRRKAIEIDTIVMHCTGGDSADGAISWMNRILGNGGGAASYHYLIPKKESDGIIRMCDPLVVAYHAGKSAIPPARPLPGQSVNRRSIGISFANDNGADNDLTDDPLTPWQWEAALWLCVVLGRRFLIPAANIYGHLEVAPGRKTDPLPRIMDMNTWRARVRTAREAS
jgi:N-acetylmuramoyl-L-alanine amidase